MSGLRGRLKRLEKDAEGDRTILEDPQKAKRVQGLKEAAEESRRVARTAKTRLSEADGSADAVRERQRVATQGAF